MSFILFKIKNSEIIRFIIIGFLNTFVDFSVLNILLILFSFSDVRVYPVLKAISFIMAVVNSYIFNKYWVFLAHSRPTLNESGKFLGINLFGLLLNLGVSSGAFLLVASLAGNDISKILIANISALCGTLAVAIMNFLAYKHVVFQKIKVEEDNAE